MADESREVNELLSEVEDGIGYCERMLAAESRLDLVIHILEDIRERLMSIQGVAGVAERRKNLEDRANILYHRAKTLQNMSEETKSLQNGGFR
ncbi:MAG: hypothetical protein QW756_03425 [Nitrososphaerota archaeon]